MKKSYWFVLLFAFLSSIFIYRDFFLNNQVPFSANLLASFYTPWNTSTFSGWENGIPNKPLGHDGIKFFLPGKRVIVNQINSGLTPLWNPYVFAGGPLTANMQSSVYYPTTLLYLLLPLIDAWSLVVIVTPVISIFFMFLYVKALGHKPTISVFIGFLWAYSSFFAVWNQENPAVIQSALWLPIILYFVECFRKKRNIYLLVCSALAMTLSFFGGHVQFSLYTFLFSSIYFIVRVYNREKNFYLYTLLFIFLPLLAASVQLIPSIESFLFSPRNYENSKYIFDIYLVSITHLINIVAPDWKGNPASYNYFDTGSYYDQVLYIGLIPFLFAIVGYVDNKINAIARFYFITVCVTMLLGFNNVISYQLFNTGIPFFSAVIPSRIFFLTSFSLLILASFGIESMVNYKNNISLKKLLTIFVFPLVLLVSGWVYFYLFQNTGIMTQKPEYPQAMFRNLALPSIVAVLSLLFFLFIWKFKKFKHVAIVLLCILAFLHQIYSYSKNVYFSSREFVYPDNELLSTLQEQDSYYRVVGFGKAAIKPNILSYFSVYSPEGLDPLLPGKYAELSWYAMEKQTGKKSNPLIEISFEHAFAPGSTITGEEPIFRFFDITATKYIITHVEDNYQIDGTRFGLVRSIGPYSIWEYSSLPKVFLSTNYSVTNTSTELLDEQVGSRKIQLEKDPQLDISSSCVQLNASIASYSSQEVTVNTDSDCEALLYLSDLYYPGWGAFVNGKEAEVLRANYSFRAVKVPKGKNKVEFIYDPKSFQYGLIISSITIIGVILFFILTYVKRSKK